MPQIEKLISQIAEQTGSSVEEASQYLENKLSVAFDTEELLGSIQRELGVVLERDNFGTEKKERTNDITRKNKKYRLSSIPQQLFNRRLGAVLPGQTVLQLSGVDKRVGNKQLFEELSFHLNGGEKVALVGQNGIGKTTLLKIIANQDEEWQRESVLDIMYVDQHLFQESCQETVLDVLFSRMGQDGQIIRSNRQMELAIAENRQEDVDMDAYLETVAQMSEGDLYYLDGIIEELLTYFGFSTSDLARQFDTLSGGEKLRLTLAAAILRCPDILVIDEPTNHLDIEGIIWLEDLFKRMKSAIVCVSHDRFFLQSCFDSVVELHECKTKKYSLNYERYLEAKAHEMDSMESRSAELMAVKRELEQYINQHKDNPLKGAIVARKRRSLEQLELPPKTTQEALARLRLNAAPLQGDVLFTSNLQVGHAPDQIIVGGINLHLTTGQKLAVMGPNGAGKTTFLRTIMGEINPLGGEMRLNKKTVIGYLSQFTDRMENSQVSVIDALGEFASVSREQAQRALALINIRGADVVRAIGSFSGGEKVKIAVLALILKKPNLILLDEPTNHLDLRSKEELIRIIGDFEGNAIVATHDRYFASRMAARTLFINESSADIIDTEQAVQNLSSKWIE